MTIKKIVISFILVVSIASIIIGGIGLLAKFVIVVILFWKDGHFELSLEEILKIIKGGMVGGAIGGVGIWLMAYFSQQSPKR